MSHYRVLGVAPGASRAQIRAAYVRLAREAHPDVNRSADRRSREQAVERMCALNEAWRVLGDPSRRRFYDERRVVVAAGAAGRPEPPAASPTVPSSPPTTRSARVPGAAPSGGHGNPMVLVPAGLFGLAVVQFAAGLVIGVPALVVTGALTLALSVAAFAAAPLVMMATVRPRHRPVVG